MQKTSGFHRLLAVLASVLLAVCCLPLNALAEEQKVPVELEVSYQLDTRALGSQTISLGELTYRQEAQIKGTYNWEDLYGKMDLPADTKIKNKQTGDCELTFSLKSEGRPWKADLTVEVESAIQHPSFRVQFDGVDEPRSVGANIAIRPGSSVSAWDFLMKMAAYKTYADQGYRMTGFTVSGDDHAPYTEADHYGLTAAIEGKTITVRMEKVPEPRKEDVAFTLLYLSNDENIRDSKAVTIPYDPQGTVYDLWEYLADNGPVKQYAREGYTLQSLTLPGTEGDKTITAAGQLTVTPDLAGKTLTVHLYKAPEPTTRTVNFELRFLSTDNQIHETKAATLTYDPEGVLTDVWDFLLANGDYQNFAKGGYQLSDYVISRENGDLNGTARGIRAVTADLEGETVIVHLVKPSEARPTNVDFTLHFLSADGKIDVTKAVSVPYDPNGKSYDAWNYLLGTGTFQSYSKDDYTLKDLVVHQAAGEMTYTRAGQFTVTPALQGATVLVHLDYTKNPAQYESVYTVHFVDENGKEFQPAATVKLSWTEDRQLNLAAQLQEALKTVGAKGYTFRSLSAWNSSVAYKGTELVVPGNWELAAHCTKNAAPAKPQKPGESPKKPAAETAKAKPAETAAKTVVKPAAPAANNTKILPKTGLQLETPVVFGVMLFAALAGAAVYLIAVRKKLN